MSKSKVKTMLIAFLVNSYLTKAGIPKVPQPPYSPDVAPDFFVSVPEIGDENFEVTKGIQAGCTSAPKAITERAFRDVFNA